MLLFLLVLPSLVYLFSQLPHHYFFVTLENIVYLDCWAGAENDIAYTLYIYIYCIC